MFVYHATRYDTNTARVHVDFLPPYLLISEIKVVKWSLHPTSSTRVAANILEYSSVSQSLSIDVLS